MFGTFGTEKTQTN